MLDRSIDRSGWNVFDFVIVLVTLVSMSNANLPGVSVLRLFRAFRVFRLFRRIESLRIIIEGIMAALPGVGNAFVLLGLLMGIWSIIGVEFFREYADEEFGNFLKAMFTMWQVRACLAG
jgi:voltage-gated sodium channel